MVKVVKKKINMSDKLKTKIDWSCRFAKHKYEIYEGYLVKAPIIMKFQIMIIIKH